jgi:hypothetical protein
MFCQVFHLARYAALSSFDESMLKVAFDAIKIISNCQCIQGSHQSATHEASATLISTL